MRTDTDTVPSTARSRPWLLPREHGAYGQLAFPLATALAVGHPSVEAWLLVFGAVAAFLAHEPLAVLLGQRGRRLLQQQGTRARWQLGALVVIATTLGGMGLWLASPAVRLSAVVPAVLAAVTGCLLVLGREKTAVGELIAASAFASAALPVAQAAGGNGKTAMTIVLVWALASGLHIGVVRGLIARGKSGGSVRTACVTAAAGTGILATATILAVAGRVHVVVPLALLAPAMVAVGLAVRPLSPRRLRHVGWTLIGASGAVSAVLILGLR